MTPEKSHRVVIFAVMGFVVAYTIAVFFVRTDMITSRYNVRLNSSPGQHV